MNKMIKGWLISRVKTDKGYVIDKLGNEVIKAERNGQVIVGPYDMILHEINLRANEEKIC